MPAAVLSGVLLGVSLWRRRPRKGLVFAVTATLLLLTAMTITLVVNVPIDRQIQTWTTATLPPDWNTVRDRWEFYHGLRTAVSLAALASVFASTLSMAWRGGIDRQTRREEHPRTSRSTAA